MYRSYDEAARARALAAFERKQTAVAALGRLRADSVGRREDSLDLDAPGLDFATLTEALERDAKRLKSELRAAEKTQQRSNRPDAPEERGGPRGSLGAALARHVTIGRRLRTIAPLVHAARAARGLGPIDVAKILAPRPPRGTDEATSIRELTASCDEAEGELARLELTAATGTWAGRADDAGRLCALVGKIPRPPPEVVGLHQSLARYHAAVAELGAGSEVRGGGSSMGALPEVSFASTRALVRSDAHVRTATERIRALLPARLGQSADVPREPESDDGFWPTLLLTWASIIGAMVTLVGYLGTENGLFFLGFVPGILRAIWPTHAPQEVGVDASAAVRIEQQAADEDEEEASPAWRLRR